MQTMVDKVAIVTGASSGIGAATARELARRGACVVLAARRSTELEAQVRTITEAGSQAIAVPTDVSDLSEVMRLVERARREFGRIDVLVNNAGASWAKPVAETSADEIIRLLQVNLLGAMLLTRAVLPEMQQRRHGAIISVSSVAGHVATEPLYSAAKFGVRGFSLALRRQLAGSGVSVSLVMPGNIRTRMTSATGDRLPAPELVATTIAELVVNPRREVIVPLKYHAVVWLDQQFPGIADSFFHRRHRHDGMVYPFEASEAFDEARSLRAKSEEYRSILMDTSKDKHAVR
jgi:NAD(P)-dependent dehydrogenase (short-subunit alcohol dehydrogenase family)